MTQHRILESRMAERDTMSKLVSTSIQTFPRRRINWPVCIGVAFCAITWALIIMVAIHA